MAGGIGLLAGGVIGDDIVITPEEEVVVTSCSPEATFSSSAAVELVVRLTLRSTVVGSGSLWSSSELLSSVSFSSSSNVFSVSSTWELDVLVVSLPPELRLKMRMKTTRIMAKKPTTPAPIKRSFLFFSAGAVAEPVEYSLYPSFI